ncbi:hypothetical protein B9Z47_17555 [Limnohabitans sp. 2KL-1]|jgi:hypothetical protein|uniref:hypothetical protein n=1 Tax=Limnohabitans sp. 2KL-1 TaxID=1100699 RepID=UPI000D364976|nr:hypothetical protein [Limnohabitans sp. 2KL-1]PUE44682.1 hypothetical protein B9Z47_17555 [Limnohabitans sp. 2KL-1]
MSSLWLKIFLLPPGLLKNHLQGYADLAAQELADHVRRLKCFWLLGALSAVCLLLGLALGGVAALLWSALPRAGMPQPWVLPTLPFGLCLLGVALGAWACRLRTNALFPKLRHQVQLDILTLKQVAKT